MSDSVWGSPGGQANTGFHLNAKCDLLNVSFKAREDRAHKRRRDEIRSRRFSCNQPSMAISPQPIVPAPYLMPAAPCR